MKQMIHFSFGFVLNFDRYLIGELILLVFFLAGIIHWGLGQFAGIGISTARAFGYPTGKQSGNGGLYFAVISFLLMIVLTVIYFFFRQ